MSWLGSEPCRGSRRRDILSLSMPLAGCWGPSGGGAWSTARDTCEWPGAGLKPLFTHLWCWEPGPLRWAERCPVPGRGEGCRPSLRSLGGRQAVPPPSSCSLHPAGSQGCPLLCSVRFSLACFSGARTAPQNQIQRGQKGRGSGDVRCTPAAVSAWERREEKGDEAPGG